MSQAGDRLIPEHQFPDWLPLPFIHRDSDGTDFNGQCDADRWGVEDSIL